MARMKTRARGKNKDAPIEDEVVLASGGGGFAAALAEINEDPLVQAQLAAEEAAEVEAAQEEAAAYKKLSRKERRALEGQIKGPLREYPDLMSIKPKEGLVFHSDYFKTDDEVACIMGFFHDDAASDHFPAFWGTNLIPVGLPQGVMVVLLEQTGRQSEKWVDDALKQTEKIGNLQANEQAESGTVSSRRKTAKRHRDTEDIVGELQDGASYLQVQHRILVKARNLDQLDAAVEKIRQIYVNSLATVRIAPYHGQQRDELKTLMSMNKDKLGKGNFFTSVEYAGAYNLVTNGLNDARGEYVGNMVGDVNSSAVLFDVNGYRHHVVVADPALNLRLGRSHVPDMWGSKISQSALLANGRVVHLVLDGANLDVLGPKLTNLTSKVDMQNGDVNMFELFGESEDELSLFPAHLTKLVLMAEQLSPTNDSNVSIIRGSLEGILTKFYVYMNMWADNAKDNRARLRLVGLPHDQVPTLNVFTTFLDQEYVDQTNRTSRDDRYYEAISVLRLMYKNLLSNNTDLFNTTTSSSIDGVRQARRVIYDFSSLMRRGEGVAMAQLVNIVGFAVESLGEGDTVIIHGSENIADGVKKYLNAQFGHLYSRGGRVAFLYNDIDLMMEDQEFNKFDDADYTILGQMRDKSVAIYQEKMAQQIPPDLEKLIKQGEGDYAYLRRDITNVVFRTDLLLGVNPIRAEKRAKAEKLAAIRAEELQAAARHNPTTTNARGNR